MADFVTFPNLPVSAGTIAFGDKYINCLQKPLMNLKIRTIAVPDNPYVDTRLSSHADLSVLHTGGSEIVLSSYLKNTVFCSVLRDNGYNIYFQEKTPGKRFPEDVGLNICIIGEHALYSAKYSDPLPVKLLTGKGIKLINVNQAYCRCSAAIVSEKAVITSDKGIECALNKYDFDVLYLEPGKVKLDGYSYGFIGGAAFLISKEAMAFTGRFEDESDERIVSKFLYEHGVTPVYLTDNTIFDIGSAIPILEN